MRRPIYHRLLRKRVCRLLPQSWPSTAQRSASRNVVLVSDSRELIAQARTAMKKRKTGLTVIDSLDDLEAACRNYCAAVDGQKVIPLAGRR